MRTTWLLIFCLLLSVQLNAQEEFFIGRSANALHGGKAIFSGEYTSFAFENIKARRFGLDIAYGVTDRWSLSVRGSASDFPAFAGVEFETGTITLQYQFYHGPQERWNVAAFGQFGILSRTTQIPGDISFDGNTSGFNLGLVATRNWTDWKFSATTSFAKTSVPQFIDGLLDGYGVLYNISVSKAMATLANENVVHIHLISELAGQFSTEISDTDFILHDAGHFLDWIIGAQATFGEHYRVETALQTQLSSNLQRFANSLYHIRLKYLL